MDTEGEILAASLLATQIEDANLGVWDTTTETGLGVRLVLTVTIAASRTTTSHLSIKRSKKKEKKEKELISMDQCVWWG
jgi:hypothetical protein